MIGHTMDTAPLDRLPSAATLHIAGQAQVLICASVFPFRIPREHWAERLRCVVELGYTAVDVYVPWNLHEPEPGHWDFTGERDVEHFLELCSAAGLLVLARPGPYICSEWDGGGLPAWLPLTGGLALRQAEASYLGEVERWFERIMPLLARHQLTRGGPVALVQLENELDFFDCLDPASYIAALGASARRHGIEVPLVACAGQGDIARATGLVDGILPAVNLYPDDDSVGIEEQALYYVRELGERGLPLLVTETNRLHRTLKRLVVTGARLLGPYLQTGGWNPDHGTSVNNWGDLMAFMTHDYDFGGVVAPDGTVRRDAIEAVTLTRVVRTLGRRLAEGVPLGPSGSIPHDLEVTPHVLALEGGGQLVSLTRLAPQPGHATLGAGEDTLDVEVPGGTCLLLPLDVPLPDAGAGLAASSGELVGLETTPGKVRLSVCTRGKSVVIVTGASGWVGASGDVSATRVTSGVRLTGTLGDVELTCPRGTVKVDFQPLTSPPDTAPGVDVDVVSLEASAAGTAPVAWTPRQGAGPARSLEALGAYRGAGRYRCREELPPGACGLLLRKPSDVFSVSAAGAHLGWSVCGGADVWIPSSEPGDVGSPLEIVTRTWGHSNFDDPRLPSLRLGSQRGLFGALAVLEVRDWSDGWLVASDPSHPGPSVGAAPAPFGGLAGWMTGVFPQSVRYRRVVDASAAGTVGLHTTGLGARIDVSVEGRHVGSLTPLTPDLWLGALRAGDRLDLVVHRTWGEDAGSVHLLRGHPLDDWAIDTAATPECLAGRNAASRRPAALPLTVDAGTGRWLRVRIPQDAHTSGDGDAVVRFDGDNLLITALSGDRLLGRIWTQPPPGAALKGGRGDVLLIPRAGRGEPLDLLLECTSAESGTLRAVRVGGPIDIGEHP